MVRLLALTVFVLVVAVGLFGEPARATGIPPYDGTSQEMKTLYLTIPLGIPGVPAQTTGVFILAGYKVGDAVDLVLFLRGCRTENGLADRPFDIVIGGMSPSGPAGRDLVGPLADLGITWWDERMPWGNDLERTEPMLRRMEHGPPRI